MANVNLRKFINSNTLPFITLGIIMMIFHIIIGANTHDDIRFAQVLSEYKMYDYLTMRYEIWSSRLIIEFLMLSLLQMNIWVWRILDTLMFVLIAFSISRIFIKDNLKLNWILIFILLLYPLTELSTAGWVATTLNYLWPLAFGLYAMIPLAKIIRNEDIKFIEGIIYTLSLIIASNVEQMSAIITAVYFIFVMYFVFRKKPIKYACLNLILGISSMLFILTCPGNEVRKAQEVINWFPQFDTLTLVDKLRIGFTTALTHFVNKPNLLFLLFSLLIFIYLFKTQKNIIYKLIGCIPLISSVVFGWILNYAPSFNQKYILFINDVKSENLSDMRGYIMIVILLLLVAIITFCIILIFKKNMTTLLVLMILGAGLVSRVIIAFSPTVYASQQRTAIFLHTSIIICSLLIYEQVSKVLNSKQNWVLKSFIILIGTYSFISSLLSTLIHYSIFS